MTDETPAAPRPQGADQPATTQPAAATALAAGGWRCPQCGAALAWSPKQQSLTCRSCGGAVAVSNPTPAPRHPLDISALPATNPGTEATYRCPGCGASSGIPAVELAGACTYCQAPWVLVTAHHPLPPPDGVVPATIDLDGARADVATWVRSRWFAPNAFRTGASQPTISLAYHPVWVFAANTVSMYQGERGTHRTEMHRDANGDETTETVTDWRPVSGSVAWPFSDLGIGGAADTDLRAEWDFSTALAYDDAYLVGTKAVAATIPLAQAWTAATAEMDGVIRDKVRQDIGGDEQRITELRTAYSDVTGRYLLAPSWSGTYSYAGKTYEIAINAETGVVEGTRPYSAVKIAAAVIAALIVLAAIVVLYGLSQHH